MTRSNGIYEKFSSLSWNSKLSNESMDSKIKYLEEDRGIG